MDSKPPADRPDLPPPTLAELPQQARLEEVQPPSPDRELDAEERAVTRRPRRRMRPDVDRRLSVDRLTAAEVRTINAFMQLRRSNPRLQPTLSELAYVLGRSISTVHQHVQALCRKGVFVRLTHDKQEARRYAMTPEAAARPHLAALARVATRVVKLTPSRLFDNTNATREEHDATREEYETMWALARSILNEITLAGRVMTEDTCAALDREQQAAQRARTGGQ